ncbi:uncharacterized protein [Rutidosis leptorrhynchoides]|uniref:uncharacterized protein n=1 Tax=Rutidosis leptorrhynchoides TaxID=125765 RepID=UPI003A99C087
MHSERRFTSFEIDLIILYLSRKDTLQRLTLANHFEYKYKLTTPIFSFNKLEFLTLKKLVFKPRLTFNSFSTLRYLRFDDNVEITTKSLKHILTNCPLLKELYLHGKKEIGDKDNGGIAEEDTLTFIELFISSPSLENLEIEKYYMEHFSTLDMPLRLPILLVHLKALYLGVSFMEQHQLLCCFCLIRSSPNLTNFTVKNEQLSESRSIRPHPMRRQSHPQTQCDVTVTVGNGLTMDSLDLQEGSNFKLDHLHKLEMRNFSYLPSEVDLLKLIMNQACVLQKILIELKENYPVTKN